MTESGILLATLIVGIGSFIASGGSAAIAWWKAKEASQDKDAAETARDQAVEAQQAAAEALKEANEIAGEARDILRAKETRATERHRVDWVPHWEWETGKWYLGNHGPDTALKVRLTVESPTIGRTVLPVSNDVPMSDALVVDFPAYAGQGGMPGVRWRVDWESPAGMVYNDGGDWPE